MPYKPQLIAGLRSQKKQLEGEIRHCRDDSPDLERLQLEHTDVVRSLQHELTQNEGTMREHLKKAAHKAMRNPKNTEAGATFGPTEQRIEGFRDQAFSAGMRALDEHYPRLLSSDAATRLEDMMRNDDPASLGARYIAAVSSQDYASAFASSCRIRSPAASTSSRASTAH